MFISLGSVVAGFAARHKIKNQINRIGVVEASEKVIRNTINSDIRVVWCKNDCILLKTKTSAAASEVRLKDVFIKAELKKNNIFVASIKCII